MMIWPRDQVQKGLSQKEYTATCTKTTQRLQESIETGTYFSYFRSLDTFVRYGRIVTIEYHGPSPFYVMTECGIGG